MTEIIVPTPNNQFDVSQIEFPSEITFEDPTFHIPSKINISIGCELYFELLKPEKLKSFDACLLFQNSMFAYLVTETIKNSYSSHFTGLISVRDNLDTVRNFSNLEYLHDDKFIEDSK